VLRAYQARPERLRERIAAEGPGLYAVVIDEVQKAPQLLDVVHRLVEERPELRFVLTGSSARKLRHGAANLLSGRLLAEHMPPSAGPLACPVRDRRACAGKPHGTHLSGLYQLCANGTQLSFWGTRAGLDVDFVVYGPNLFQAMRWRRSAQAG
jgi:hypothetical protein